MRETIREQCRVLYETLGMLKVRTLRGSMRTWGGDGGHGDCTGLTPPQMHTLMAIRAWGSLTVKGLAEAMQVSAPSASAMVERLVESGTVTREQNHEDRREVLIRLTPKAVETLDQMDEHIMESLAELLARLGPEYAEKWFDVCRRIQEVCMDEDTSVNHDVVQR